jgi:hypothetical protein
MLLLLRLYRRNNANTKMRILMQLNEMATVTPIFASGLGGSK